MQLMQIIGDRQVRLISDLLVGSNGSSNGLVDGLLSMILWHQTDGKSNVTPPPLTTEVASKLILDNGNLPVDHNLPKDGKNK